MLIYKNNLINHCFYGSFLGRNNRLTGKKLYHTCRDITTDTMLHSFTDDYVTLRQQRLCTFDCIIYKAFNSNAVLKFISCAVPIYCFHASSSWLTSDISLAVV